MKSVCVLPNIHLHILRKLAKIFPSDSEKANYNKLYSYFMKLTETGQGIAIERVREIAENHSEFVKEEYRPPISADAVG